MSARWTATAGVVAVVALVATPVPACLPRELQASQPAAETWRVSAGTVRAVCRLTVGGSFEAESRELRGDLRAAGSGAGLEGALRVPLDSFDTGIGLRNTHMREHYLETSKGPTFAHAALEQIALAQPEVVRTGGRSAFDGVLTLHGTRRQVRGQVQVSRSGDGLRVEARLPVRLPDFGIPEPRYLGIGVRDDIEVRVDATFTAGGLEP